jgi:hypothetical protein
MLNGLSYFLFIRAGEPHYTVYVPMVYIILGTEGVIPRYDGVIIQDLWEIDKALATCTGKICTKKSPSLCIHSRKIAFNSSYLQPDLPSRMLCCS